MQKAYWKQLDSGRETVTRNFERTKAVKTRFLKIFQLDATFLECVGHMLIGGRYFWCSECVRGTSVSGPY